MVERRVFLSHSSEDKVEVQRLRLALTDRGIGTWEDVLELRLIAAHAPRYNRRSKFPDRLSWVKITTEVFPRLSIVGAVRDDGASYFGPFPRRQAAEDVVLAIYDGFPLRQCTARLSPTKPVAACALASCVTVTRADSPAALRPPSAVTPSTLMAELVGCVCREPFLTSAFSAASKPVIALLSDARPLICAVSASARLVSCPFLAANCASTSAETIAPVSRPEPVPSVLTMEAVELVVTMSC